MVSLLRAWHALTAAAAHAPETYQGGRPLHLVGKGPPTHRHRSITEPIAVMTDVQEAESNDRPLKHATKIMPPMRRRVLVEQSTIVPKRKESNDDPLAMVNWFSMSMGTVITSSDPSSSPTFNPSTPWPTYMPTYSPTNEMTNSPSIEMSVPIRQSEMSMSMGTVVTSMGLVQSEMSMSMGSVITLMPLEQTEMSISTGTVITSMPLGQTEMSMSMGTIEQSLPMEPSEMSMSMETIEMSMPMEPTEISISMGTVEMSMPMELSDMSISMGTIVLSMPMELSEMSMSVGTIELSMPMELSEMIMSVGTAIDLSIPLEVSEMSMSMGTIEMSIPMEPSQMSMSMGTVEMSLPMELSEMSMSTAEITAPKRNESNDDPLTLVEFSSMSMGTVITSSDPSSSPTFNPSTQLPTYMPTYSPTNELTEYPSSSLSDDPSNMPSKLPTQSPTHKPTHRPTNEMTESPSSSLSNDPSIMPSKIPTQLPTYMPTYSPTNEMTESPSSSLSEDPSIMPSKIPTQSPTESPVTTSPTTSPPVETVESSDASVSIDDIPSKLPTKSPTPFPSKLPTKSPTLSPVTNNPTVISVKTNAQFQLIGMDADMDAKASNVFKQSCASFLMEKLGDAQISCEVTNQRLLSLRRLRAKRGLEGESSLLVDVTVAKSANATSSVLEASDANFGDQVIETFASHSSQFTTQLQEDGIEAGIDDFERLTSMSLYSISDDVSEIVKSPDGSDSQENGNKKGQYLAIATISISGLVILAVFAVFLESARKRRNASIDDDSIESESSVDSESSSDSESGSNSGAKDVYGTNILKQQESLYSADNVEIYPRMTPMNGGDITYKYSLDDGFASPESILSRKNLSPLSIGSPVIRKLFDIIAPPGKLGIIIDTCSEGPIVHSVKGESPLEGLIFKGDLIVAIDNEDTKEWSAHYLTKLVAKKSKMARKFTVLRPVMK